MSTNLPPSWSAVRKMISGRKVLVNSTLCVDETRRLRAGDVVSILATEQKPPPKALDLKIVFADEHLVIVDKPPGIETLRRHDQQHWDPARKALQPTLDELTAAALGAGTQIYPVHRLDRDTSGLMLFALNPAAQTALIRLFKKHQVHRTYLAVVHGVIATPMTIETTLVRDRGDGIRGSGPGGKLAVTHVKPVKQIGKAYTIIECRLETGRTHQIRIHLSEAGHMLCGEKIYLRRFQGDVPLSDTSAAPRHALHSAEIQLLHPVHGNPMHFHSPLPMDLKKWIEKLG